MWNKTRVSTTLGIEYPIIQGPFGGGHSSVALLAAVSNAGGLGSFGAHHLDGEAIRDLAVDIRAATRQSFSLNIWLSDHDEGGLELSQADYDRSMAELKPYFDELGVEPPPRPERIVSYVAEQLEAILAVAPPVFSFVFGVPDGEFLRECRARHIVTIGAATTVEEAVRLDQAGVDLIVASGFEAGGHRVSFLKQAEDSLCGTFALVPQVVDAVRAPVIAAGGIADARGIRAALALGAEGVQIGTAFLACEESNASPQHRQKLLSPEARRTVLTRGFTGRLARGISNRLATEVAEHAPYPAQSRLVAALRVAAVAQERYDLISLWSGQAAPLLKYDHARELFDSLVHGMGDEG